MWRRGLFLAIGWSLTLAIATPTPLPADTLHFECRIENGQHVSVTHYFYNTSTPQTIEVLELGRSSNQTAWTDNDAIFSISKSLSGDTLSVIDVIDDKTAFYSEFLLADLRHMGAPADIKIPPVDAFLNKGTCLIDSR